MNQRDDYRFRTASVPMRIGTHRGVANLMLEPRIASRPRASAVALQRYAAKLPGFRLTV